MDICVVLKKIISSSFSSAYKTKRNEKIVLPNRHGQFKNTQKNEKKQTERKIIKTPSSCGDYH